GRGVCGPIELGFVLLTLQDLVVLLFFFQAEDGIRDFHVTGVQTCALLMSRDRAAVRTAWSRRLAGLTAPTLVRTDTFQEREFRHWQVPLSAELSTALAELGRRRGLTLRSEERRGGKGGGLGGGCDVI